MTGSLLDACRQCVSGIIYSCPCKPVSSVQPGCALHSTGVKRFLGCGLAHLNVKGGVKAVSRQKVLHGEVHWVKASKQLKCINSIDK